MDRLSTLEPPAEPPSLAYACSKNTDSGESGVLEPTSMAVTRPFVLRQSLVVDEEDEEDEEEGWAACCAMSSSGVVKREY